MLLAPSIPTALTQVTSSSIASTTTPLPTQTRQWILSSKPTDLPILTGPNPTFTQHTTSLPALGTNQVLVRTLYLSNDPAQRGFISPCISADRLYMPPVQLYAPMRALAIAQIVATTSFNPALQEGAYVTATTDWTEYSVHNARSVQPLPCIPGVNMTHFLGALGLTGLTAYIGLVEIARAGPTDTVVISGAAGATGSMAVQIAKRLLNCRRVIGIAGGAEKCAWVVERLGADECLNYKAPDFMQHLVDATQGFVEVYFDNVGGEILDAMLGRLKRGARVVACGGISNYNRESAPVGLVNWHEVIANRLEIKGFIVFDYLHRMREVVELLLDAIREGRIVLGDESETVVEAGFDEIPQTWMMLFRGGNMGKLVTKLM